MISNYWMTLIRIWAAEFFISYVKAEFNIVLLFLQNDSKFKNKLIDANISQFKFSLRGINYVKNKDTLRKARLKYIIKSYGKQNQNCKWQTILFLEVGGEKYWKLFAGSEKTV